MTMTTGMTTDTEATETVEVTAENWRTFARCRITIERRGDRLIERNPYGIDPELFWPIGDAQPARDQEALAKRECHRCPVMSFCAAWALERGEVDGVSGGMTPDEKRAALRKRPARVAA